MKKILKNILTFLACLLPWFFSSLFQGDSSFYQELYRPKFAPPGILFAIIWPILYILIAITIYKVVTNYNFKNNKDYYYSLIINFIFNQSFTIFFFALKSPCLGMVSTIGTLISGIFLYLCTKERIDKLSYLLIPYLLWGLFASILSLSIYFMNL